MTHRCDGTPAPSRLGRVRLLANFIGRFTTAEFTVYCCDPSQRRAPAPSALDEEKHGRRAGATAGSCSRDRRGDGAARRASGSASRRSRGGAIARLDGCQLLQRLGERRASRRRRGGEPMREALFGQWRDRRRRLGHPATLAPPRVAIVTTRGRRRTNRRHRRTARSHGGSRGSRSWARTGGRGCAPTLLLGSVLAAILVPQGMAYAELAGLSPVTGLYTTIACLVGYAFF